MGERNPHAAIRKANARIDERGFDAFATLLHRRIGHAHGDEVLRHGGFVHIHLDIDWARFNAVYGSTTSTE
jgi:hypothetical protein